MNVSRILIAVLVANAACIAPSVVDSTNRAPLIDLMRVEWMEAERDDLPGTYVSEHLSGPVAAVLLKVVYLFEVNGSYTGAGLVDGNPPQFEVISGTWTLEQGMLTLDDAPPARLQTAADGSKRITGQDGEVILRREVAR